MVPTWQIIILQGVLFFAFFFMWREKRLLRFERDVAIKVANQFGAKLASLGIGAYVIVEKEGEKIVVCYRVGDPEEVMERGMQYEQCINCVLGYSGVMKVGAGKQHRDL